MADEIEVVPEVEIEAVPEAVPVVEDNPLTLEEKVEKIITVLVEHGIHV